MLTLEPGEREFLTEMRAIAVNAQGVETLVGLTLEESFFYFRYANARVRGQDYCREDGDRYLELHDKHERARLTIIGAEVEARNHTGAKH